MSGKTPNLRLQTRLVPSHSQHHLSAQLVSSLTFVTECLQLVPKDRNHPIPISSARYAGCAGKLLSLQCSLLD